MVSELRISTAGSPPDGPVVYWMTRQRRMRWNPALEHAVARAQERDAGLAVIEVLPLDAYASDRFHTFALAGMLDNAAACQDYGVTYRRLVERRRGDAQGVLENLAKRALVVTDASPMASEPAVGHEQVDGHGVMPLAATPGPFKTAASFRRFLQRHMPDHLLDRPASDPLAAAPGGWDLPRAVDDALPQDVDLARLPIDHDVGPTALPGGPRAAAASLADFLDRLDGYLERDHPDAQATSRLSPYLRWGHVGAAQVVWAILEHEDWDPGRIGESRGQRQGWWGLTEAAEAFLDQVVTWRELGGVETWHRPDCTAYASLPAWARESLEAHADDPRDTIPLAELEAARSPDALWNAAQRQLREEGILHNYMRMLWGKSILRWTTPEQALEWMFHLNDKYALDGRDPNSISGITWCLGRYDRGWPEREIFGKVRCMTSSSARRKLRLDRYLATWGSAQPVHRAQPGPS